MDASRAPAPRLDWLDAAKAWGMLLVYYGHFVEKISQVQDLPQALTQQKFVYAFHMPLFFVIAGYLARTSFAPPLRFLQRAAATRLVPYLFFILLGVPFLAAVEFTGDVAPTHLNAHWIGDWTEYAGRFAPPEDGADAAPLAALYRALTPEARAVVDGAAAGDSITEAQGRRIVDALNEVLDRRDLFPADAFHGIGAPGALPRLLGDRTLEQLSGDDLRRYNILHVWKALWPEWDRGGPWEELGDNALGALRGMSRFNVPIWFLLGLFVVECYHYLAGRFLVRSVPRLAAGIVAFGLTGWFLTRDLPLWSDIWFAREAVLLYAFYLFGLLLRRSGWLAPAPARWARWLLLLVPLAALAATFRLNPGAEDLIPVVLINLSRHGDPLWFVVGALGGTLAVFGLSMLTPMTAAVRWTGRSTLILMGLNGFWFEYLNEWIAAAVPAPAGHPGLAAWCLLISLASIAVSAPAAMALQRWVPHLVGQWRLR